MNTNELLEPIPPGEILREEFLLPRGLSAHALAQALRVPATRISEILHAKRGISADTALRLARYFGTSAEMWLGIQAEYEMRVARRATGAAIEREVEVRAGGWSLRA